MSPKKETNETIKAIIGSERAFHAFTTSQWRYVRIFHTPYDLIEKAGLFDTQLGRYVRRELSPAKMDHSPLVESCQRVNLNGNRMMLQALLASENDAQFVMLLFNLNGNDWIPVQYGSAAAVPYQNLTLDEIVDPLPSSETTCGHVSCSNTRQLLLVFAVASESN